ncbi:peptidoglycan DD-metalloendopeptidase family protein [Aromatoleum anaerobium]|uniref:Peptidoglycan DD-metalloendopeptidase family protein n=1 Tax=Aromatoleum anaerobium TaxID=182180 RepID=A0ABX1PR97_9RHOO|nr:peptidoglycan DD-metalloendopeptidase family protein [Aromatoleum anaerobium]MCK0507863.1 peptidoglycan DD-metalloendopeptidase family protein [Aromatoleum anaerobium]
MAFVILSAGTLTQSRMHTISARVFAGVIIAIVLAALAGGFALGYMVDGKVRNPPQTAPVQPAESQSDLLIGRFGELAGRMVQLQAEAAALTERIGAIKDFEARINENVAAAPAGRIAKTPLGSPAGGPLLQPVPARAPELPQFGLLMPPQLPPAVALHGKPEGLLAGELAEMERDIERLAQTLAGLDRLATGYSLAHMSFPGRSPVAGFGISSGFGNRSDPFRRRLAFHSGVDFPAPAGTQISASAGGRVVFAGRRPDYGLTVEIDHGAGLATRYAHASKLHVKVGQVVLPGDRIASIGSTGRSTGAHLHFEVMKDGLIVDPASYLAQF